MRHGSIWIVLLLGFILLLALLSAGCGSQSPDDHVGESESSEGSTGEPLECEPAVYWVEGVAFTCCCNEQDGVDVAQRPLCPESVMCP